MIDYKDAFEVDSMPYLLEKVEQHILHNQKAVLGVMDDVSELIRMQSQVKGVQHGSSDGNAEVGFQMGMAIPHQRSDAISSWPHPHLQEQPLIVWSAGADLDRCSCGAHRQAPWRRLRPQGKACPPAPVCC